MTADNARKTFVLVHGAWAGGWCYGRVADLLRSQGHRVYTPTLTGLGERSHLAGRFPVTCGIHIQDVSNLILWEDLHSVVLCGHSYGGVVITGVADVMPQRIASLVYLDAIIPEAGRSVLDVNHSKEVVAGVLQATAAAGGQGVPPLPAALFGTNADDVERLDRLSTPQPFATFCEPVTLTGRWRTVGRKTYVRATQWQGYDQLGFDCYQNVVNDPDWETVDIACGHEVMLDAPEALAGILLTRSGM